MAPDENGVGGSHIGRQMIRGTLWMVGMRWVIRLIGLANTAIIARILIPEDFGLIALSMIVVDLLITITDGDIDMALVRQSKSSRDHDDTGWTFKIIAAFLTFGILWVLAPLVAAHFSDERIVTVIRISALRPLLLGFENIRVVEFRRTLRFSTEFRYLVIQRLCTFFATLGLVFIFRDYRALAVAMPVSGSITVALSYWIVPGCPRLCLTHWRELWQFSRWQMLFNSARLVGERCDQAVISRLAGLGDTGVYVVGFDLALMPSREIMLPAGRALMPTYAKLVDSPDDLHASFQTVLGVAAVIAAAVGVGVSMVAEDAVPLILGPQWGAAVPFVRWLGLFGALEGLWLMLDPVLIAARHERTLAMFNLAFSALTIPAVAISGIVLGIQAIPAGRIAVMIVILGGVFLRMIWWHWISPQALLKTLWRPVLSALIMAVVLHHTHGALFATHLFSFFTDITVGAITYCVALAVLWWMSGRPAGTERLLAEVIRDRLKLILNGLQYSGRR